MDKAVKKSIILMIAKPDIKKIESFSNLKTEMIDHFKAEGLWK